MSYRLPYSMETQLNYNLRHAKKLCLALIPGSGFFRASVKKTSSVVFLAKPKTGHGYMRVELGLRKHPTDDLLYFHEPVTDSSFIDLATFLEETCDDEGSSLSTYFILRPILHPPTDGYVK